MQLWATALSVGVAYNGAAAALHGSGAVAFAVSASAHYPAWNGLRPVRDMAIGDIHWLQSSSNVICMNVKLHDINTIICALFC